MIKLSIDKIEEGMKLGEDITTSTGKILLTEGTILTKKLIEKIRKLSITVILIERKSKKNILNDIIKNRVNNLENSVNHIRRIHIKEEIEEKFKEIAEIAKNGILNLHIPCDEIIENCDCVEKMIRKHFSANTLEVFECILSTREKDEYLFRHSINVSTISYLIGKWLGYGDKKLSKLLKAALLHDIGKLRIPRDILNKPGKLTEAEFGMIKNHSIYTQETLTKIKGIDKKIVSGATLHHEKIDGSGYPFGLQGEKIPEFARIIAIADIFDAMTSDRVYHKKRSPFKVIKMFEESFWGTLDYKITRLFTRKFLEYYIGVDIVLNNGTIAKIVRINPLETAKPLIQTSKGEFIDLSLNRNLAIETVVS